MTVPRILDENVFMKAQFIGDIHLSTPVTQMLLVPSVSWDCPNCLSLEAYQDSLPWIQGGLGASSGTFLHLNPGQQDII